MGGNISHGSAGDLGREGDPGSSSRGGSATFRPDEPDFSSPASYSDSDAKEAGEGSGGGDGRLIPTVFKWEHGGNEVFITGTFNNWSQKVRMHLSGREFIYIRDLPRGQHAYKFIVDGEWRFSHTQPVATDSAANINNIIDLRDFRPDDEEDLSLRPGAPSPGHDPGTPPIDDEYGVEEPDPSTFAEDPPPKLPPHLRTSILNAPQSSAPHVLPEPTHVTLNHLYCTAINGRVMVQGVTQRYRRKAYATVFYSIVPVDKRVAAVAAQHRIPSSAPGSAATGGWDPRGPRGPGGPPRGPMGPGPGSMGTGPGPMGPGDGHMGPRVVAPRPIRRTPPPAPEGGAAEAMEGIS